MKNVAFILYTHSEYSDVWEAFFGQTEKFLDKSYKKYVFVDKGESLFEIPDDYTVVHYENDMKYTDRFSHCLEQVKEDVCIFQHEDMFLYGKPDEKRLSTYLNVLKENDNLDFIKLLKGGDVDDEPFEGCTGLFKCKEWLMAIQPALWKVGKLKKVFAAFLDYGIWDLERDAQEKCKKMGIKGVYCYNGEAQRGSHHWDSDTYPYVATAICKGKWNTKEYACELEEIFHEYGIDRMERGFVV